MRYVIDIPQNQSSAIEEAIKVGKYKNFAQFIIAALENQIYIESTEINDDQPPMPYNKENNISFQQPRELNNADNTRLKKIEGQRKVVPMPAFPGLVNLGDGLKEEHSWLWGQINRILPIKIGLRVLYNELGSEQWIDLEKYRDKAAEIAAEFGTRIKGYEDKKRKLRDQRITAGLPEIKEFKSQVRYKGQFLAYMRKNDKLDGAMAHLKFVNLKRDEREYALIGITEPGLQFAQLENPVMDSQDYERGLSEKEIDFYLSHISKNVQCELNAITWLLSKVNSGIHNREGINKKLKGEFGPIWKASDSVINTQRAGLTARMSELGLIDMEKEGITVKYTITKKGENFLNMQR